jgi:hypothetical protein
MRRITKDEIFDFRDMPERRKIAWLARLQHELHQLEKGQIDETLDLGVKV